MIIVSLKRTLNNEEQAWLVAHAPDSYAYTWPYKYIMFEHSIDATSFVMRYSDIIVSTSETYHTGHYENSHN